MNAAGDQLGAQSLRLTVDLAERSYDIVVGDGLLGATGRLIEPILSQKRVAIVTDDNVAALYLPQVEASLDQSGIAHTVVVLPAGEPTKDFAHLQTLCERLLAAGLERGTTVLALGGGVVGDITGFAAGILLRGLPYVQLPTTLLAQVDSSVGGKTGINTAHGKNLVGLFHQPRMVIADVGALATLDHRQLLAGYAEVVKYGLIGDAGFFSWLEVNGAALIAGDRGLRRHAVLTSCAAKAAIVAADEREAGLRALLNLGHTFGHALEVATGYGEKLLHGEAVAIGMALAFELSAELAFCSRDDARRVSRLLRSAGLPTSLADVPGQPWTASSLLADMGRDKKVRDGRLTFILARGIGQAFISREVAPGDVLALLQRATGERRNESPAPADRLHGF